MSLTPFPRPLRIFLDAGVTIDGCFNSWGFCKSVLILATLRRNYRIVLAESIEVEVMREILFRQQGLSPAEAHAVATPYFGWLQRVRVERVPWPTQAQTMAHNHLLPIVHHVNDMPSVVAAVLAQPDVVLSTNTRHWNPALATATSLFITTPMDFAERLHL